MEPVDVDKVLEKLASKSKRYRKEAYQFVLAALNFIISNQSSPRHVTGRELLEGIRQFGLEQFGPMTRTVFEHWGVKSCVDFGEIVYRLIDEGLLVSTETDRKEDFEGGYDFQKAFDQPYEYREDGINDY